MTKKKWTKTMMIAVAALLVIGALVFMGMKGFFTNPGNFVALVQNKVLKLFHDVTQTEPSVQEEYYPDENGKITPSTVPRAIPLYCPVT